MKAPAIELVNPDLLASHVNAEWLAAAQEGLGKSIPENLDMDDEALPVCSRLIAAFETATSDMEARERAVRIVGSALPAEGSLVIGSPEDFVTARWDSAGQAIDLAFKRWRTLYRSANEERREASAIADRPGLAAQARKDARSR